ncbi:uncharacterized protein LOC101237409 isoform X1 [Hydra vulgaris]|uniref:uncharacterized protein LOC101237409 isoform X1 n=1 Tax=Hydra vulgaris TaxID=6087 RepID=UPI001F5FE82E|nr:uncharacterized protein LOC101237409 isoform X1 [Hydra vulgaris]XP_047127939.1 uncharacterized protein LOC101237409 isoform X1 [Hydra vulgaris]
MLILFLGLLIIGVLNAVKITSLYGGDKSKFICPSLYVNFNSTQQNDSSVVILITNSYNHTFPKINCLMITKFNGVCNVSNLYFNNGELVHISVHELSGNGTVLKKDSIFWQVDFTMIFGPFTNILKDVRGKKEIYISYDTLTEDCYKVEKVEQIELEQCLHDQKWICSQSFNPEWLYYGCEKENNVSIYQTCYIKLSTLEENYLYRFRLRYSIGYNNVFSTWSDYLYHNTNSAVPRIPPALKCSHDEKDNNAIKISWSKPTNDELSENYTHFLVNIMDLDVEIKEERVLVTSKLSYEIYDENSSRRKYKINICTSKGCSKSAEYQCFFNSSTSILIVVMIVISILGVIIVIAFVVWYRRRNITDNNPEKIDIVCPRFPEKIAPYSEFHANNLESVS